MNSSSIFCIHPFISYCVLWRTYILSLTRFWLAVSIPHLRVYWVDNFRWCFRIEHEVECVPTLGCLPLQSNAGSSNILMSCFLRQSVGCRLNHSWLEAGFLAEASKNMTYYRDNSEHLSCKPYARKERNAGFQDAYESRKTIVACLCAVNSGCSGKAPSAESWSWPSL